MTEPTLPALAKAISGKFPELGGRSIAATDVDPFTDMTNVPTLPIAVCALAQEDGNQPANGGGRIAIEDNIIVQMIFDPVKYQNSENVDTPFWAFYDYETIRDRLLSLTRDWQAPRNGARLSFQSMAPSADEFGVYLTFRFTMRDNVCLDEIEPAMTIGDNTFVVNTFRPVDDCIPEDGTDDPCDVTAAHEQ